MTAYERVMNKLAGKSQDSMSSPRMLNRIKAIELFNGQVKHQYPIEGWGKGALAEVVDLRNIT